MLLRRDVEALLEADAAAQALQQESPSRGNTDTSQMDAVLDSLQGDDELLDEEAAAMINGFILEGGEYQPPTC